MKGPGHNTGAAQPEEAVQSISIAAGSDGSSPTPAAQPGTSTLSALVAGPIAGVCTRFVIYPGDTIKARLQVQGSLRGEGRVPYKGLWDAARQIARGEGLRGFYKGFGVVVVGNIPANAAYFGGFELGKALVPAGWGLPGDMLVGAAAQLTGGLLFTPVDIIKERMQVQGIMAPGQMHFASSWHALTHLVKLRGPLGLFRGYWATNAVWIPWSMLHISCYEQSKRLCQAWRQPHATPEGPGSTQDPAGGVTEVQAAPLPPWVLGVCSATSASIASVLTHPMDVVKTRLQVLSTGVGSGPPVRLTARDVALTALRNEGPRVFMAGAAARVLTLAPGSALTWMMYEPIKNILDNLATQQGT